MNTAQVVVVVVVVTSLITWAMQWPRPMLIHEYNYIFFVLYVKPNLLDIVFSWLLRAARQHYHSIRLFQQHGIAVFNNNFFIGSVTWSKHENRLNAKKLWRKTCKIEILIDRISQLTSSITNLTDRYAAFVNGRRAEELQRRWIGNNTFRLSSVVPRDSSTSSHWIQDSCVGIIDKYFNYSRKLASSVDLF